MLNKNLYFIHNFDSKLHYSIYYSLLKVEDNNETHFNDSVQRKKCNHRLGRWNFIVADEDYSCGVYHSLETIPQAILLPTKKNKNSVDIALVSTKNNPDICYVFNYEKKFKNYIDLDRLKKFKAVSEGQSGNCKCDKKISKRVFFKVIKPVLEELF